MTAGSISVKHANKGTDYKMVKVKTNIIAKQEKLFVCVWFYINFNVLLVMIQLAVSPPNQPSWITNY